MIAAAAALMGAASERKDPAFDFIAGNRPVTGDHVRQKLVSDRWNDVQIVAARAILYGRSIKGRTE